MNTTGFKKLVFTIIVLFFFFTGIEIVTRLILPEKSRQPLVVERFMDKDVQHDWLESDPILFWKLVGANPGETVFRVEESDLELISELCETGRKQQVLLIESTEGRIAESLGGLDANISSDVNSDHQTKPH